MCKILDKRFRKDGIRNKVKFSLSDNSDGGSGTHKYLISSVNGLKNISDIFNSHTYIFGYETTNSKIFSWERMNCRLSNSAGKPHFVGEYGSNQTVGATRQKDINLFERGVLMARIAINCLNAGASGLSYWSLFDQYYGKEQSYDQMQQLGLWKSLRSIYSGDTIYGNMKSDYEPRPQYYAYSLLTRFIRSGAEVHPVNLNNEYMAAIAIKNQNGKWVYIFANGDNKEYIVELSNLYGGNGKYGVYKYLKNELPSDDGMLMPQSTVEQSKTIKCKIPENSVIVLAHN
jgi:alpha-galactosidase